MAAEAPQSPGYEPSEQDILETFLVMTLEEHDGFVP